MLHSALLSSLLLYTQSSQTRINRSLEQFKVSWNNHDIRTERGALRLRNSGQVAVNFFDNPDDSYGVNFEEDIIPHDGPGDDGVIPANRLKQVEELKANIDPLAYTMDCLTFFNKHWIRTASNIHYCSLTITRSIIIFARTRYTSQ